MSGPPRSHDGQVELARRGVVQCPAGPPAASTGVKGRLTTAVYAASVTPAPRVRTALEAMLRAGPREWAATMDESTDIDSAYRPDTHTGHTAPGLPWRQ